LHAVRTGLSSFLFSLKFILGTSFIGSIGLAIIAMAAYLAMIHFIGGAFTVSGTEAGAAALENRAPAYDSSRRRRSVSGAA
jgi:hypothetical protein